MRVWKKVWNFISFAQTKLACTPVFDGCRSILGIRLLFWSGNSEKVWNSLCSDLYASLYSMDVGAYWELTCYALKKSGIPCAQTCMPSCILWTLEHTGNYYPVMAWKRSGISGAQTCMPPCILWTLEHAENQHVRVWKF